MNAAIKTSFTMNVGSRKNQRIVWLYFLPGEHSTASIDAEFALHLRDEPRIDRIYVVGDRETVEKVVGAIRDEDTVVLDRLKAVVPNLPQATRYIFFDNSAGRHVGKTWDGEELEQEEISALRQRTLQAIFVEANALNTLPPGIHYRKPSGAHSNQYIKTADVIARAGNAEQIAFWLIPIARQCLPKKILVDTSGIAPVAYALVLHLMREHIALVPPVIHSHRSYEGLASEEGPIESGRTLAIVSATTSGRLRRLLLDKGIKSEHVLTLYFLGGDNDVAEHTLCNLTRSDDHNPDGLSPVKNYSDNDCPLCKKHSLAVRVQDEHFDLTPPVTSAIDVVLSDLPREKRESIALLAGAEMFSVGRTALSRDFELFVDVSPIFRSVESIDPRAANVHRDARERWDSLCERSRLVSLRTVVHTRSDFSEALAAQFVKKLPESIAPQVETVSSKGLERLPASPRQSAVVIASTIDEPLEITGINKNLRERHARGNVQYIVVVHRGPSQPARNHLRSSITFGEFGPTTFAFNAIFELDLPGCRQPHPWSLELKQLQAVKEWCELNGMLVDRSIQERIDVLSLAPRKGLLDDLFWDSPSGRLAIRSDFTLIPTEGGTRKLSQADIYFAIASLLNTLRTNKGGRRLVFKPYERTVLSADSFFRFNDGVIQASLLRAALPCELCYSHDAETESAKFTILIESQIAQFERTGGEALAEFVVSILIGQLTLRKQDTARVLTKIVEFTRLPKGIRQIAEYMMKSETASD
jgi:hypothetical protein